MPASHIMLSTDRAGEEQCTDMTTAGYFGVVVTGDNHLAPRLSRLPANRADARRERLRQAFASVVTAAIEREADLFIQAGDLFDIPDPNNYDRAFVAEQFARLARAGITTCAVSGNHDMPRQSTEQGGAAPLSVYAELGAMHYFHAPNVISPFVLERHQMRLAVAGISNDPGRRGGEDPLATITLADPEQLLHNAQAGLLIVHAALAGGGIVGEEECVIQPESLAHMGRLGFQIVVTGHIHRYQRRRIGAVETVVCGPSEWMDFADAQQGAPGYAWLEIGPRGELRDRHINFAPQPRRTLRFATHDLWPEGTQDGTAATERVIAETAAVASPDTMVRVFLEGPCRREQYRMLDIPRIRAWGIDHCFSFELNEQRLWLDDEGLVAGAAERGEQADPRSMLATIFAEQLASCADDAVEATLWQATRESVLQRFDALSVPERTN